MSGAESLPSRSKRSKNAASAPQAPIGSVLERLLHELSLRERLVVCLRYADGLSVLEIAAVLDAGSTEIERVLDHASRRVRDIAGFATA